MALFPSSLCPVVPKFGVSLLSGPTQTGTPFDASPSDPAHGQGTYQGSPTGIVGTPPLPGFG